MSFSPNDLILLPDGTVAIAGTGSYEDRRPFDIVARRVRDGLVEGRTVLLGSGSWPADVEVSVAEGMRTDFVADSPSPTPAADFGVYVANGARGNDSLYALAHDNDRGGFYFWNTIGGRCGRVHRWQVGVITSIRSGISGGT